MTISEASIFKMCAPSRRELNEKHGDARDKLQEYWNYLKQASEVIPIF